jgi:hypothetical protein
VEPTVKLSGSKAFIVMEDKSGADVLADEQDIISKVKAAIKPKI